MSLSLCPLPPFCLWMSHFLYFTVHISCCLDSVFSLESQPPSWGPGLLSPAEEDEIFADYLLYSFARIYLQRLLNKNFRFWILYRIMLLTSSLSTLDCSIISKPCPYNYQLVAMFLNLYSQNLTRFFSDTSKLLIWSTVLYHWMKVLSTASVKPLNQRLGGKAKIRLHIFLSPIK